MSLFGNGNGTFEWSDLVPNISGSTTEDLLNLLPLAIGAGNAFGLNIFDPQTQKGTTGYQGVAEPYTFVQDRVNHNDAGRRPGSGGRRYFSDVVYARPGELNRPTVAEAQQATSQQAADLAQGGAQGSVQTLLDEIMAGRPPVEQPAPQSDGYMDFLSDYVSAIFGANAAGQDTSTPAPTGNNAPPVNPTPAPAYANNEGMSQGDIGSTNNITYDTNLMYKPNSGTSWVYGDDGQLQRRTGDYYQVNVGDGNFDRYSTLEAAQAAAAARNGDFYNDFIPNNPYANQQGFAAGGKVGGPTDGMADQIAAIIGGQQPAALSGGEFVMPADVVSMAGNGNTEAGAKLFEDMMAEIRRSKTGTDKQAPPVDVRGMLKDIMGQ